MKRSHQLWMLVVLFVSAATTMTAQDLQYYRPNDLRGLNMFETPKANDVAFNGLKVWVGGDFAIQFQGLSQSNSGDSLNKLTPNFNLPTANLNLDVQLDRGVRLHMRTYLSSRHHNEAYIKGGYLQIDELNFIKEGFASGFMEIATIRFGMDEINYGDAHFRRSDNARAMFNPFVGNYIMDSFTTEPFAELTIQKSDLIAVVGATNGRLNQKPVKGDNGYVAYGKLGYDSQMSEDLRVRLTASFYTSSGAGTRDYLYGGDRAGSRYYELFGTNTIGSSDFSPRFNPRFAYQDALQVNPFVKFKGLELFGIYELVMNGNSEVGGEYTQMGAELLYRFGSREQLYVAGRYNSVSGKANKDADSGDINRVNAGLGWFLTPNMMAKAEYVMQSFEGAAWEDGLYEGAEFNGFVLEAVISF